MYKNFLSKTLHVYSSTKLEDQTVYSHVENNLLGIAGIVGMYAIFLPVIIHR